MTCDAEALMKIFTRARQFHNFSKEETVITIGGVDGVGKSISVLALE